MNKRADLTCLAWGGLQPGRYEHMDCPVVVTDPGQVTGDQRPRLGHLPAVCMCDCTTCKRAWWDMDRPTLNDEGKVVTASGKVIA